MCSTLPVWTTAGPSTAKIFSPLSRVRRMAAAISRTVTAFGFSLETGLAMNSNRSQHYAVSLWLLLGLFVIRVIAQPMALYVDWHLLPRFEAWHSGVLPYPVLVLAQVAIVLWLGQTAWRFSTGTIVPRSRVGRLTMAAGAVSGIFPADVPAHAFAFGEDQGRYVVTARDPASVLAAAQAAGVPATVLGRTGGVALTVNGANATSVADLRAAGLMEGAVLV